MKGTYGILIALLPFYAGCSEPGVYQRGKVTQVGDLPCFTVADTDETRSTPPRLASLGVEELSEHRIAKTVWHTGFLEDRPVLLSPDRCIAYGAISPDFEVDTRAAPLRTGVVYAYGFNSDIPSPYATGSLTNRVYMGHFCLTRDAGGKLTVHDVQWDEAAKRRHWEVCNLPPHEVPSN